MTIVNIGIIGLGHIGNIHIRALRQFEEINLLAACDKNKKFESIIPNGVDFYTNHKDLLQDDRIDTVIIATPNNTHYTIAKSVLKEGKNIILEKPATESMHEFEDLESTAKEFGLYIYFAFHAACAFEVKWFIDYYNKPNYRTELGPVTGFISRFYDPYIQEGRLLAKAKGLQDCWLDSGINAISVIQKILDIHNFSIENVSAALNYNSQPRLLQCHSEFSFPINGTDRSGIGVVDTNWTTGRNHKSTILSFGISRNYIKIDHSRQRIIRRFPNKKEMIMVEFTRNEDRLFNHYIGVFKDYLYCRKLGFMNNRLAKEAHKLLFDTEDNINIF